MPCAVLYIQWDSYAGKSDSAPLFAAGPLTYNSRQPRLHDLSPGDQLWLVSRAPDDRQYYFVAVLTVAASQTNAPDTREHDLYGPFAIIADPADSHDLARRFPAEGLLRAFQFDTAKPIKYGASIGQSLQTLRFLDAADAQVLAASLGRLQSGDDRALDAPAGLWTKCDRFFADSFLKNWTARKQPQGFLLYDPPPGQSHVKSLSEQDFGEVGVVPAGGEAFVFDADFERRFVF